LLGNDSEIRYDTTAAEDVLSVRFGPRLYYLDQPRPQAVWCLGTGGRIVAYAVFIV
jgi:hypothetical protein